MALIRPPISPEDQLRRFVAIMLGIAVIGILAGIAMTYLGSIIGDKLV